MYIKKLINDKNVGAVISTPKNVAIKMLDSVNFETANSFVEYGPGGGIITKQILNRMKPDAILYVFETNLDFIEDLNKINDNRLIVINENANMTQQILKSDYNIDKVDYIFSTSPFSFFNHDKRNEILSMSYNLLQNKGRFITCQYSWLIYKNIKNQFTTFKIKPAFKNIPPSFILEGIK